MTHFKSRIALHMTVPSLLLALIGCHGQGDIRHQRDAPPRRNAILITLDTLRADHLDCYGYQRITAPNLCAFAAECLVFEDAYAPSSWTLPSHASILTGLLPHQHGAENFRTPLSPHIPYLPEILAEEGYATGAFVSSLFVSRRYGFDRGFETFVEFLEDDLPDTVFAERITDAALAWLEARESDDRPYFLWLHYFDIHNSFIYHPDTGFQYEPTVHPGMDLSYERWNQVPYNLEFFDEAKDSYVSLYDGEIYYVDSQLDRLLGYLHSEHLLDTTIIATTSDHGESFNDHRLVGHDNFLYQDLTQVPLLIRSPDVIPGRRTDTVQIHDLLPTILDFLDVPRPRGVGDNLLDPRTSVAVMEVHNRYPHRKAAIVKDRWKLIFTYDLARFELYNLDADPREMTNEADRHPERVDAMAKTLFSKIGLVQLSPREEQQLRSLGYLQ